jgi:hypothetical protein
MSICSPQNPNQGVRRRSFLRFDIKLRLHSPKEGCHDRVRPADGYRSAPASLPSTSPGAPNNQPEHPMQLNPILAAALAGACGLASSAAHADAFSWDPSASFSGFGTIGYVKTDNDQAQFVSAGQPAGAGKDGSFSPDSKLGGQVNAKANSVFSATVQAVSKYAAQGTWKPTVEWAFVKAQATPDFAVRAGRIGLPFYMVSDYINVDYSNLWIRPPIDVYGQVAFDHFDGADGMYQTTVGSTTLTGQVFVGETNTTTTVRIHARHSVGMNLTAEFDNGITARIGYAQAKITVDSTQMDQLVGVLSQTPFASVGEELSVTNKDASFAGAGISWDHENFVGSAEYTKRKTSSYISSTTGWSVTGGYRIGKFTPYAVVSKLKVDNTNVNDTIPAGVAQLAALRGAVEGLLATQNLAQKTDSIGLRWDAYKNVAVKFEYDHIKPDGGVGLFEKVQPGFGNTAVNVYGVAVDFVF